MDGTTIHKFVNVDAFAKFADVLIYDHRGLGKKIVIYTTLLHKSE